MCRHSSSISKFSYCLSVRITPVGTPVEMMMPSRTLKVPGAQFTLTQPERSFPLKRGTQSAAAAGRAEARAAATTRIQDVRCRCMKTSRDNDGRSASSDSRRAEYARGGPVLSIPLRSIPESANPALCPRAEHHVAEDGDDPRRRYLKRGQADEVERVPERLHHQLRP